MYLSAYEVESIVSPQQISFAPLRRRKQHQPFLLRFQQVVNPSTAITQQLGNVDTYTRYCCRGRFGVSTKSNQIHVDLGPAQVSLYIYQTGMRAVSLGAIGSEMM